MIPSLSVLRLLSAALLCALLFSNSTTSLAQTGSRVLEPEVPLSGELKKDELHSYRITLLADQLLHVEIKSPQGFGAIMKLRSPDGQLAAEIDQRVSPFQTQRLLFVAQVAGEYRLEFGHDSITPTAYVIQAASPRPATAEDRSRYAAQQVYAQAANAVNGTEQKIRAVTEKLPGLVTLYKSTGDSKGEAETLYLGGVLHSQLDEGNEALHYFTKALPLTRELGDRRAEAYTLSNLSDLNIGLGEPHRAIEYAEQSLSLWRDLADLSGEALTLHNTSVIFRRAGDWPKAFSYQQRALELWQGKGGAEAFARLGLGHNYRWTGEQERALDYYRQALALWEGLDSESRFMRAVAHAYLGEIYNEQGERQRALDHLNRGLVLVREVRDTGVLEGSLLLHLGSAYEKSGELQKALAHYNEALKKIRPTAQPNPTANVLYRLGQLHLILGDAGKAEDNFKEALSLRRQINDRVGEAVTLSGLTRVEQRRGNHPAARAHIENALEIIESLRTKIINPEVRASFFAQSQDSYKLYIDVLMQLHKREPGGGHAAGALLASERARARSLVETLSESRAELRGSVDPSMLTRERILQQRVNAKADRLTRLLGGAQKGDDAIAARKELESLLTELRAIQDEIRARSPRYAALVQPQPPTLPQIQAVLDPDTLLLEYSLGEERSYLWAVTSSSFNTYELPARSEIDASARRVYEALTARNKSLKGETSEQRLFRTRASDALMTEAAGQLSQTILRPALQHLNAKRLVVVSEGALQYVPFAALPMPRAEDTKSKRTLRATGETAAQPLVAEHEIVNLPSVSTLVVLRQERRKPAAKVLAVLADPVFENNDSRVSPKLAHATNFKPAPEKIGLALTSPVERSARESGVEKLERLHFSGLEAETIASFAPENMRFKAVGFQANKSNATSPDLSGYRIVHFASHGLINTRHPELSGIVLSLVDERGQPIDGFLRLHEIYNLKLNADLVVLSACQTALGKEIKGEGFIGLSRGFMYAGAPRVVASLWRIDDRATAELVGLFYKAMLEKKMAPAAALQHAQIEMSKKWPSPYHWAGFTLQGEWR